ncbi:MAG: hypothetical protein ACYDEV_05810 [Acidiferrobacter sp.]
MWVRVRAVYVVVVVLGVILARPGFAGVQSEALAQAVAQGAKIFSGDSFGSHLRPVLSADAAFAGLSGAAGPFVTCATCHIHGGKTRGLLADGRHIASLRNAVAVFPRYSKATHKVVTIESQIRRCVTVGVLGHAPRANSRTMVDLVSYLTAIAHGQKMAIGGPFR